MTNAVSGGTGVLPSQPSMPTSGSVAATGVAAQGVTSQPLVTGDPGATSAALTPTTPAAASVTTSQAQSRTGELTDAALASATGIPVIGGGAPGSGPDDGIPAFVRQFLPGGSAYDAGTGATSNQQYPPTPPAKGSAPKEHVQHGWQWVGCTPPRHAPEACPMPTPTPPCPAPDADPETGPPAKVPPPPPGKDGTPPGPEIGGCAPPANGTPPAKGDAPAKGERPTKAGTPDEVKPSTGRTARTYTVKRGDTLSKIADRFGTTWQKLHRANKGTIDNPNLIFPGTKLKIPGSSKAASQDGLTPGTGHAVTDKSAPTTKPPTPPKGDSRWDDGVPTKPSSPSTPDPGPSSPPPDVPTPDSGSAPPDAPPDGPPGTDPGSGAVLPSPPPVPESGRDGLPPALPSGTPS